MHYLTEHWRTLAVLWIFLGLLGWAFFYGAFRHEP
jgi:hypothetical protein